MGKIFVTRKIPEEGIKLLEQAGHEVDVSPKNRVLSHEELLHAVSQKPYDAVLCLLTDHIQSSIMDAAPTVKVYANYAVGYDNIDLEAAKEKGIVITNTPGVLTDAVAEHTFALIISLAKRITEADSFTKSGKFEGWGPMLLLGTQLKDKTLGLIGVGRIGTRVAEFGKAFGMNVIYYDINKNEHIEKLGISFREKSDNIFKEADFVSVHVPLMESTKHLVNAEKFSLMKKTAFLINTSRGPVIDENALLEALKEKKIRGAALDVYEFEPQITTGLEKENTILTPHIASATEEARGAMSKIAAENIIAVLNGETPRNPVTA